MHLLLDRQQLNVSYLLIFIQTEKYSVKERLYVYICHVLGLFIGQLFLYKGLMMKFIRTTKGLMMKFIRATREGNWLLHLSTLRSILPCYFAADRDNYSRYASVYWLEMNALEETHPGKKRYLTNVLILMFIRPDVLHYKIHYASGSPAQIYNFIYNILCCAFTLD